MKPVLAYFESVYYKPNPISVIYTNDVPISVETP